MKNKDQLGFNFDDPTVIESVEEKKAKEKAEIEAAKLEEKKLNDARTSLKNKLDTIIKYQSDVVKDDTEDFESTEDDLLDDEDENEEDDSYDE